MCTAQHTIVTHGEHHQVALISDMCGKHHGLCSWKGRIRRWLATTSRKERHRLRTDSLHQVCLLCTLTQNHTGSGNPAIQCWFAITWAGRPRLWRTLRP